MNITISLQKFQRGKLTSHLLSLMEIKHQPVPPFGGPDVLVFSHELPAQEKYRVMSNTLMWTKLLVADEQILPKKYPTPHKHLPSTSCKSALCCCSEMVYPGPGLA